jgi:hypothetical protein
VVAARHQRDTSAVFRFDPVKRETGDMLAGHPKEDIVDIDDPLAGTFGSVFTIGMKPIRQWFDGRWAGLQNAVDAALPGRLNGGDQLPGARRPGHTGLPDAAGRRRPALDGGDGAWRAGAPRRMGMANGAARCRTTSQPVSSTW